MNPVAATFDTADQQFPHGTVAAGFLLTLTEVVTPPADGSPSPAPRVLQERAPLDARSVTIADVPVGTYTGSVSLIDVEGNDLAPAVVDPAQLVIADVSSVTLPVPTSLTLTRP